jgi:hypothetical protein
VPLTLHQTAYFALFFRPNWHGRAQRGGAHTLSDALEHARGRLADAIITFGRVPLFYYVLHIFLIHALAAALAWLVFGSAGWLLGEPSINRPANYGLSLPGVYLVWLFVVLVLYPACRWFDSVKQHRREWWWSYL